MIFAALLREEGVPQDLTTWRKRKASSATGSFARRGPRHLAIRGPIAGKSYGLRHTWWIDEAQDPRRPRGRGPAPACDLYKQFGDWLTGHGRLNCGPGQCAKRHRAHRYADFWSCTKEVLPRETKKYVTIIIALTLLAKGCGLSRQYSSGTGRRPFPPRSVKPGRAIDLRWWGNHDAGRAHAALHETHPLLRCHARGSFLRIAPSAGGTAAKLSPDRRTFRRPVVCQLAARTVGVRRKHSSPREEIPCDGGGHGRLPNSRNAGRRPERGREVDYPATLQQSKRSAVWQLRVRRGETLGMALPIVQVGGERRPTTSASGTAEDHKVSRGMVLRIYTIGGAPEKLLRTGREDPGPKETPEIAGERCTGSNRD